MNTQSQTIYEKTLAGNSTSSLSISVEQAQKVFAFFQQSPLFRWKDANNDCEDRANAICILLDAWKIPNSKAWVFAGTYLQKQQGELTNLWNYHVAAALPVNRDGRIEWNVIDPATTSGLVTIENWAQAITQNGCTYHFIKEGKWYIFPQGHIKADNWHERDRRNFNWTMQGLTGFNGASVKGKAQLSFHKNKVRNTLAAFRRMLLDGLTEQ